MTRKDLTELVLVLDRSGSMASCVKDMEGGAAQLIQDQKDDPGDVNVTYVRFDDVVDVVYQGVDINEIGVIKLEPRGMTALYDGIGIAIQKTGERLASLPEHDRPGLVIVAIMTDGFENVSRMFDARKINEMIKHQTEKYGWQFTYLGANQDSFAVGSSLGIDAGKISNYNVENSVHAFVGASNLMRSMKSAVMDNMSLEACSYLDEDREAMVDNKAKQIKS